MCGIAGLIEPSAQASVETIARMAKALEHRGPDDFGVWSDHFRTEDEELTIAFGHCRLSILDLSSRGHQPMLQGDGRLAVTYNGEIYNFRQLRAELERLGSHFTSESDTEVILAAYHHWGDAMLERLHGMFALAIWDGRRQHLLLARDRLGIKPMYYSPTPCGFLFGSELGAFRAVPWFDDTIDRGALGRYLRFGSVSAPESIYAGTYKLLPGEKLIWNRGDWKTETYWRLEADDLPPPDSFDAAVDRLEDLLAAAVEERLVADVPLGAFLSGGIDSSTVVALMQQASPNPVRTFCVGFEHGDFDESLHARRVAEFLGTDHHELIVGQQLARDVVRELPVLFDEPFGDSSALPTLLVSRLARAEVTVVLTGDGGDELFGGYSRYRRLEQLASLLALPSAVRRSLSSAAAFLPATGLRRNLERLRQPDVAHAAESITERFTAGQVADLCGASAASPRARFLASFGAAQRDTVAGRAMTADIATYLADDILTKVDRASMSVGLEARVPILDHRLVHYALGLPTSWLSRGGVTKAPLRALAYRKIPQSLLERPKRGFGFPLASLLGDELAAWRTRYLDPGLLRAQNLLEPLAVERLQRHLGTNDRTSGKALWHLLCFQRWYAHNHGGGGESTA